MSISASLLTKFSTDFALKDLGELNYFFRHSSGEVSGIHMRYSKYILDILHRAKMVGTKAYRSTFVSSSKLYSLEGDPLQMSLNIGSWLEPFNIVH